jgi:hypothetical protein
LLRPTTSPIAVSQSVATSVPLRRISGVVSRSRDALACQPYRSFGSTRPRASVLDGDVQTVAVGGQDRRGLHSPVHRVRGQVIGEIGVDALRPRLSGLVRSARTPRFCNAVHTCH